MAAIPLYDITVGCALDANKTLLHIIKKAQAHPDAASFASARIYPDMLPFTFQVYTVTNFSKKMVERLTARGESIGAWEDNEETLEQLVARVEKTIALLEGVKREEVEPKEQTISYGPKYHSVQATTNQYVLGYALPNLLFHLSTAYDILRMKGVELGKGDFLKYYAKDIAPVPKEE
ncbi:uncharacterized protein B0T15DRAFT_397365 [Chaetomium strumarium]|uniref:DUF1993 domain-containing protein n=1 Tax=Chaetomium strumarium TaxID=1170767 RepID=A0AAJ0M1K1_9PEZI|nr:hypothetical protein B0T15DRAFT_397365 [Chaetomium strumarium]